MHHPTTTSRRRRVVAAVLAFGLVAAACGGDDSGESAEPEEIITSTTLASDVDEARPGGTLVVGLEADANSFLPGEASTNTNVARAIYDSIGARGADGGVHPLLAESIEPNDDVTEWTITLREGIEFHDGTPLDAAAIKENFDTYLTRPGSQLSGSLAQVLELRVDGPLTYTYVLAEGNAAFPDVLTTAIGYPFSNEACAAAGEECGSNPVGAGPFKFVSWTRDSEIRLERNENYWRTDEAGNQLPYLDELIFRPIPDEDSRFQSVRSGTTQVGQTFRQSIVRNAADAAESGEIQALSAIGNNGGGGIFNTGVPPVDDVRVRAGLVHALNQTDLVDILGGAGVTPDQTQFFSPDSPWFSQDVEDAWPAYDPDAGKALLDEYIADPERSDGKNPGDPIQVEFHCPPDPSLIEVAQTLQSFWNEVDVETTLVQVEQPVHITNILGSPDSEPPYIGDFMVNCWRMGSNDDPYTTLRPFFSDPLTEPLNVTNYASESITEQLEVLRTAPDFADRYAAVETIMMELADQLPLFWAGGTATSLYAVPEVRNLGGWTIPEGIQGDGVMNSTIYWSEVWLDD